MKLGKTADEIFSLLNQTFKMAIKHGLIKNNPMDIVFHIQHERVHGAALTIEEERKLLQATAGTPYQLMFAIALYTGVRPYEYKSVKLVGNMIIAQNCKRKNAALGKIEWKRIPVSPMLAPYLNGAEIRFYIPEVVRDIQIDSSESYLKRYENYLLHSLQNLRRRSRSIKGIYGTYRKRIRKSLYGSSR